MQESVVLRSGVIEIGDYRRRLQGAMEGVKKDEAEAEIEPTYY